jgi:hypothetical protein
MSQVIEFEKMIGSFDAENLEYFLLGDLNVDLISTTASPIKNKLKSILDIYGIKQLINEPTRITSSSRTLIDLCLINTPSHVVDAGVFGKTNRVSELNFNNQEITAPMDIAEAFNDYFSSVGDNLAASIPTPDHDPSFYLKDKHFHCNLLSLKLFINS